MVWLLGLERLGGGVDVEVVVFTCCMVFFCAGGSICRWRMSFGLAFGIHRVWWTVVLHWCVLNSRGYACCGGLEVG